MSGAKRPCDEMKFIGARLYTQPQHVQFTISKLYSLEGANCTVYIHETVQFGGSTLANV